MLGNGVEGCVDIPALTMASSVIAHAIPERHLLRASASFSVSEDVLISGAQSENLNPET